MPYQARRLCDYCAESRHPLTEIFPVFLQQQTNVTSLIDPQGISSSYPPADHLWKTLLFVTSDYSKPGQSYREAEQLHLHQLQSRSGMTHLSKSVLETEVRSEKVTELLCQEDCIVQKPIDGNGIFQGTGSLVAWG